MSSGVPEIVRKISPEELRELLEFLLGGPLQKSEVSISHEVVDEPTEEQKGKPHAQLSGGRIMLFHSRGEVRFETAWHPRGELLPPDELRGLYLGAVSEGRILRNGSEVQCRDRLREVLEAGKPSVVKRILESTRAYRKVGIEAGVREAIREFCDWL